MTRSFFPIASQVDPRPQPSADSKDAGYAERVISRLPEQDWFKNQDFRMAESRYLLDPSQIPLIPLIFIDLFDL